MSEITITRDLRNRFGQARDQNPRETCLAFATSDAHAAAIGGAWAELSCEYLFYHAKQYDKTSAYVGTTATAIRAALEVDGQPAESEWPYILKLPKNLKEWVPPTINGPLLKRKSSQFKLTFDDVWKSVQSDQPTVVGMTLSDAFYAPTAEGVIDSAEAPDPSRRHAVIAVAIGMKDNNRLLLARNSWGPSWGISGYGWITERFASPRIILAITVK